MNLRQQILDYIDSRDGRGVTDLNLAQALDVDVQSLRRELRVLRDEELLEADDRALNTNEGTVMLDNIRRVEPRMGTGVAEGLAPPAAGVDPRDFKPNA